MHHLKNYGIKTWYDRYELLMGDNRLKKNLEEGASKCNYAMIILSKDTEQSICAMEELSILCKRYNEGDITLFPILYELSPDDIPHTLIWIKKLIYKEVGRHTGTLEICNHVTCKITSDILKNYQYQSVADVLNHCESLLSPTIYALFSCYQKIACENLNSRITLLYAIYLNIIYSKSIYVDSTITTVSKIFERLFSETRLNLSIDYRELWLLENSICILVNYYVDSCTESNV